MGHVDNILGSVIYGKPRRERHFDPAPRALATLGDAVTGFNLTRLTYALENWPVLRGVYGRTRRRSNDLC